MEYVTLIHFIISIIEYDKVYRKFDAIYRVQTTQRSFIVDYSTLKL